MIPVEGRRRSLGITPVMTSVDLDRSNYSSDNVSGGVRVSYSDGKSVEGKPPAQSDAFAKMLAQDGTYVVTVNKGAAVLTRLIDGVPTPFGTAS